MQLRVREINGRFLVLWRLDAPEWGNTRVVRWEWMGGWGSTLTEVGGRRDGMGVAEGKIRKGMAFEM